MSKVDVFELPAASVPQPSAGKASVFVDDVTKRLATRDDAGELVHYQPEAASASGGQILHVPATGAPALYATLALALAAASSGDVVLMGPGTYTGINGTLPAGVKLEGAGGGQTILVAGVNTTPVITSLGGRLDCLQVTGTVAGVAAILAATPGTLTRLDNVDGNNCGYVVHATSGAGLQIIGTVAMVTGAGQSIFNAAIGADGAGTRVLVSSTVVNASAAIIGLYPGANPIRRGVEATNGAILGIGTSDIQLFGNVAGRSGVYCDSGAQVTVLGGNIQGAENNLHIGPNGAGSEIDLGWGVLQDASNANIKIESATGAVFAGASEDTLSRDLVVGATASGITFERGEGHVDLIGEVEYHFTAGNGEERTAHFDEFFAQRSAGWISGGDVTLTGGLGYTVAAGSGWVRRAVPADYAWHTWDEVTGLTLTASQTNYIYFDAATLAIVATLAPPSALSLQLAEIVTDGASVVAHHDVRVPVGSVDELLAGYLQATRSIVWDTGMAGSAGTAANQVTVDAGFYYRELHRIGIAGGANVTWDTWAGGVQQATGVGTTDEQWDNAGVLAGMGAGTFKSDTLITTGNGNIHLIYGTATFATQVLAAAAGVAAIPSELERTGAAIASLIVEEGLAPAGSIKEFVDRRPVASAATGGGGGGASDHGALSGLSGDDHTQYLRTDGTRVATGPLDMGANAITNVGNVDGVDVSAHASRHNPGGVDAIATAAPVAVGTANAIGVAASAPRSDHVHDHGAQTVGTHHAAVIAAGASGFMTGADKTKLDGVAAGAQVNTVDSVHARTGAVVSATSDYDAVQVDFTPAGDIAATDTQAAIVEVRDDTDTKLGLKADKSVVLTAGAGLIGGGDLSAARTFNAVANADGSLVVNADDMQVGVLATDAQHGLRGGGTQHVVATGSVAGFMSNTDKTRHDAHLNPISTANPHSVTAAQAGAAPTTRVLTAGAGLTGGGDLSSDRTFNAVANADGSIVVNADDLQVGILATDGQHGVRGGGTQHPAAIAAGASGFMTGAQVTKLDGIEAGAQITTKQMFYEVETNTSIGDYRSRNLGTNSSYRFGFSAPHDFVALVELVIENIPTAGASGAGKSFDLTSDYGGFGESSTAHSESDLGATFVVGTGGTHWDLDISTVFGSLAAGDRCGVLVKHNTIGGAIDYLRVRLRYT